MRGDGMRIAVAVAGISVVIAAALILATWRINGDDDFDPREPSFVDSLPTADPTSFAGAVRQLELLNPPPALIQASDAHAALGWAPLCPAGNVAPFELSDDGRRLIYPPDPGFGSRRPGPTFQQTPGGEGLDFIPEPFATESINGFTVAFSEWGTRYDARFETGESANGEPIVASVTTRSGDVDNLRDFIESLTFDCGD
jgi:hypothetical protein